MRHSSILCFTLLAAVKKHEDQVGVSGDNGVDGNANSAGTVG